MIERQLLHVVCCIMLSTLTYKAEAIRDKTGFLSCIKDTSAMSQLAKEYIYMYLVYFGLVISIVFLSFKTSLISRV